MAGPSNSTSGGPEYASVQRFRLGGRAVASSPPTPVTDGVGAKRPSAGTGAEESSTFTLHEGGYRIASVAAEKTASEVRERAFAYGCGIYAKEVTFEAFRARAENGLLPNPKGVRDAVCFTAIPAGKSAQQRVARAGHLWFGQYFADFMAGKPPHAADAIRVAYVAGLERTGALPGLKLVPNGLFDATDYPDPIPGINDRALAKARKGLAGGWTGEVRVEFEGESATGIGEGALVAMMVRKSDLPILRSWVDRMRDAGLEPLGIPIFDEELNRVSLE